MATIREKISKDNKVTFTFQVKITDKYSGNQYTKSMSWKPEDGMTIKQARKLAIVKADEFETEIKNTLNSAIGTYTDPNVTFSDFFKYWIDIKRKTCSISYIFKCESVYEEEKEYIGNVKIRNITPSMLQNMFEKIESKKKHRIIVSPKPNFRDIIKKYGYRYRQIRYNYDINCGTLTNAINGLNVSLTWAQTFSDLTKIPFNELFDTKEEITDYSYGTINKYRKVTRAMLTYAKRYRLIQDNYCTADYIEPLKKPQQKIECMSDQESKQLLIFLQNYPEIKRKTAILTFILTGFRRGEVAGLEWKDIDFETNQITIRRSITATTGYGVYEKLPKTEQSIRTITAPKSLMNQLIEYKLWQDNYKKELGDYYIDQDKVFTSQNGRYINPSVFTGWLNEVLVEAGLPHYSIHSLRHTNIALQIAAGVPLVTVSARAGHARTSTTSDIYAYLLKSSDQEAADQLDNVFNASQSIVNSSTNDQITSLMKIQEEMKLHGCKTLEDYMQYLNNGIC